jgi:hypothetical protein
MQAEAPSEPFKAMLAGAQAGSQIAANRNQARAQREALDQRKYEFETIQAEQQKLREYKLEEASLHIEKMKLAKDYEFQTNRAAIEIGNLVNTTDPSSPDFVRKLYGIGARYPAVMKDQVYQHAAELPEQSAKLNLQAAQAYHAMNPAPANSADEAAISNQVRGLEQQDIMEGKPPWTDAKRLTLSNQLRGMKEFKPQQKFHLTVGPDGTVQASMGEEGPTVATSSMVQKNLNTAENVDRWAPQLGLPGFDKQRATNRESLKVAVQGMVRQISSDTGRFSEGDRKRAEAAMVRPGWDENEQNARAVLDELRDIVRNRAKVDSQTGGMPIPEWSLSPDDIIDAVQTGNMTKEKAIELRLKYHRDKYGTPSAR